MIRQIEIDQPAADLAALISMAQQGDDIVFAREGQPIARLTAVPQSNPPLPYPRLPIEDADDYDAPLHEYL